MRTSAVIIVAALISAPNLVAARPTPPINRGDEETVRHSPAHLQHGLEHETHQYPTLHEEYRQIYRRPRPVRRSPPDFENGIQRYPYHSRHTYSRQADRIYGRALPAKSIINGVEDASKDSKTISNIAKDAFKYGSDALTYGTDAYEALKAGKSLWNSTNWRREVDACGGTVLLPGVVRAEKDAGQIGDDVYDESDDAGKDAPRATQSSSVPGSTTISDAWEARKDARHQIKGSSVKSRAISSQNLLQVGHDALQIGNDVHDVYETGKDAFEAGKDAYHQLKSRSMGSGAISTSQVVSAAKDAWTIGQDGYGVYKAGKDAWKQLRPQSRPSQVVQHRDISRAEGALPTGNGVPQIGDDVYAGRDEWRAVQVPRALFELD
ncbi:hypothetical protein C8Q72DRAFT_361114 [Fomitopsis betulina]|nr:hypothetical protein C8Q72DRAFT_361114 [Fomitopsis betulina]